MIYDAIVFDLDGTITDSQVGILNCAEYAIKKMNFQVPQTSVLRKFLGPPLMASFKEHCGMTEDEAKRATAFYRERYMPIGWAENSVYSGIRAMLRELKAEGAHLFIATAKPQDISIEILRHFGLAQYFDVIAGALPSEPYPDKGDIIVRALKNHSYKRAAMVGDRASDLRGAQKVNIDSIAAGYGYGSIEELTGTSPTHFAATTEELCMLLLGRKAQQKSCGIIVEGNNERDLQQSISFFELLLWEMGFDVCRADDANVKKKDHMICLMSNAQMMSDNQPETLITMRADMDDIRANLLNCLIEAGVA